MNRIHILFFVLSVLSSFTYPHKVSTPCSHELITDSTEWNKLAVWNETHLDSVISDSSLYNKYYSFEIDKSKKCLFIVVHNDRQPYSLYWSGQLLFNTKKNIYETEMVLNRDLSYTTKETVLYSTGTSYNLAPLLQTADVKENTKILIKISVKGYSNKTFLEVKI